MLDKKFRQKWNFISRKKELNHNHDVKVELEKVAGMQMKIVFSGSMVERYGIPRILLGNSYCAGFSLGTLHTDLDVMILPHCNKSVFFRSRTQTVDSR